MFCLILLTYKFDKFNENDPSKKDETKAEDVKDIHRFYAEAHVRNLCLIDSSGKQAALNYSYLMSGEYIPDENAIMLFFTTHNITLKGANLENLFMEFMNHLIKQVICLDKRYIETKNENEPYITEIFIKKTD